MLRHAGICFRSHRTVIKGHVVAGLACSWRWGGGEEVVSFPEVSEQRISRNLGSNIAGERVAIQCPLLPIKDPLY